MQIVYLDKAQCPAQYTYNEQSLPHTAGESEIYCLVRPTLNDQTTRQLYSTLQTFSYAIPPPHSHTMHPVIIEPFICPTECTTRLKLTLKYSYMLRLTNRHQGAYCCALLSYGY